MGTSETLRSVIDAGRSSRRLDELSAARVIGKAAKQVHAAQQKAGAGKAVGPISPAAISLAESGAVSLALPATSGLGYSAPEQATGGAGDRRSDVFSLGVVMWEALTHQRLFEAMNDAAVKAAINEREIKPPAEMNANIPAELSAICMRALARNPADRYQSAKSMGVEIEEFLDEAGYADNDEQIAAYLAEIGKPKAEKKVALPAPTRSAPPSAAPATAPAAGLPSVLTSPPAAASPMASAPTPPTAPTPASPPTPHDKMTTAPGLGPSVLVNPAPSAAAARTANGTSPPPSTPLVPMPPVLPSSTIVAGSNGEKPHGENTNGEKAAAPTQTAPASPAPATSAPPAASPATATSAAASPPPALPGVTPAKTVLGVPAGPDPLAQTSLGIGIMPTAPAAPAAPAAPPHAAPAPTPAAPAVPATSTVVGGPATLVSGPPTMPAAPTLPATPAAIAKDDAVPTAPARSTESAPNPVDAVSLPNGPRESKDVLAGWGWGTDSHQAIDDDDYDQPRTNSRKLLMYLIGGGVVFAAMVAVIAFGFGGSKKKHAPPAPAAATQEGGSATTPGTPGSANVAMAGSDTAATAPTGAIATGSASDTPQGSAVAADTTGSAVAATETPAAGSAAVVPPTTPQGSAAVATTGPVNPYPDTTETAKPDKSPKPDTLKPDKTPKTEPKPEKLARTETKPDKTTRPEPTKTTHPDKITTTKTTHTETPKSTKPDHTARVTKGTPEKAEQKAEAEASYKQGIMQFARGDTTGALASLRTSLAASPNYAPTWRGLGLVFEKLGEKDQARAAFKRYLQLAPSAGDAEQIRGRLERMGS